jgi:hypothetical protein
MKIAAILRVMASLAMGVATSADAQYASPPGPAPAANSEPAPAAIPDNPPPPRKGGPVVITLGETTETITPDLHGAANIEHGDIEVNASKNALAAALRGVAHAHAYIGYHASGIGTVHLVQEFNIAPQDPAYPYVMLSMIGKVDGYLRSDCNGSACLRLASATVYPVCGGPALTVSIAPGCIAGESALRIMQSVEHPPLMVPAGDYILDATFVIEASAQGFSHGQGEAVFTSGHSGILPGLPNNPFVKVDRKDFGFIIAVEADPL